ncbi:protein kinase domain-containing protein [Kitasatospora kifunensis]|uniref:non-specific serine/threonine protein kinase n=1 Tax=Kitasatospora kifunensis TaxID=58351 RepID=A0A7W7R8Y3_KITKI|nr:hypothetical protein [Kitasatospora kifunensis]MBB4927561.1 DNA-binding helix-hairpin-helix protein with protein kinase domain [Kitasatospora kifunensis]
MVVNVLAADGRHWRLTEQIGQGGEGVVFAVDGRPELVAKLVPRPLDPAAHRQRIERLVRQRREPRTVRLLRGALGTVAWPLAAVRTVRGDGQGYLMADLRHRYQPLDRLLFTADRQEHFPDASWATALRVAAALAALLAAVHAEGYLVGDLKPGNIWVDERGGVALSDVDSWQFTDRGQLFESRPRTPGYAAPERVTNPTGVLTRAADDFVLAVLVHQLLMAGLHPFLGLPPDGSPYLSLDDNVLHGRCRLTDRQSVLLPEPLPPVDLLPVVLRTLLRVAFGVSGRTGPDSRPTAADWARALAAESGTGRLRGCPVSRRHVHTVERPWCPWCDLARRGHQEYPSEADAPGAAPDRAPRAAPAAARSSARTSGRSR